MREWILKRTRGQSSGFRSVFIVSEVALLRYFRLCSSIMGKYRAGMRLRRKNGEDSKIFLTPHCQLLSHLYDLGSFRSFAPKLSVLVTRSDWPASIRIAVRHLRPSPSQSAYEYCSQIYLEFTQLPSCVCCESHHRPVFNPRVAVNQATQYQPCLRLSATSKPSFRLSMNSST